MPMAGTKTPRLGRRGYLRSPIRNEVEPSAKKICAQCSTLWPSAHYLRSIIQPNYHHSPREIFTQGMATSGARTHRLIPYDEQFRMLTLPTTYKETATVSPGK